MPHRPDLQAAWIGERATAPLMGVVRMCNFPLPKNTITGYLAYLWGTMVPRTRLQVALRPIWIPVVLAGSTLPVGHLLHPHPALTITLIHLAVVVQSATHSGKIN